MDVFLSTKKGTDMIASDIFISVRQRRVAFTYWQEFWHGCSQYGELTEDDYLDSAYRFLNSTMDKEFIEFCAKKEDMEFPAYCREMDIDEKELR